MNIAESFTAAPSERLLTLQDIQQAANISRVTAWRWTQEHGLKVIRVGRCVRVRERDWLAFLAKHASGEQTESSQQSNGGRTP